MKSEMDNREWLNAYSTLKQVSTANPFTVPAGYFDELEQQVISHVHLLELQPDQEGFTVPENYFNELNSNIQSRTAIEEMAGAMHGFAVPEDYFNTLSNQIESRIAIEEMAGGQGGFAVPEEYFTALGNNIESRIAIETTAGMEDGFAVPETYFEGLQQQISARIMVEETLQGAEQFSVPAGYFDKLSQNILDKTVEKAKTERKGAVVRKLFATAAFKYAAAACFAVVIGATVLLNQPIGIAEHSTSYLHKQVSSLQVNDIQTYLQDDVDANDTQHAVIDENTDVNDANLDNALKNYNEDTNQ